MSNSGLSVRTPVQSAFGTRDHGGPDADDITL